MKTKTPTKSPQNDRGHTLYPLRWKLPLMASVGSPHEVEKALNVNLPFDAEIIKIEKL
jgi:hypothetical protein